MLFLLFSLSACDMVNEQIDEPTPENPTPPQTDFYLTLNVVVPTEDNSRSSTNPDGTSDNNPPTLPGSNNENTISSAKIFFFDQNSHKQLCSFLAFRGNDINANQTLGSYSITTKIEFDEIKELIGKKVNLYVLANIDQFKTGEGSSDEEKFLNGTFLTGELGTGYAKRFLTDKNGELCPLTNNDYYTIDLTNINASLSNEELRLLIQSLFKENYSDGKRWDISTSDPIYDSNNNLIFTGSGKLSLQRSIARVDIYVGGNGSGLEKIIYNLPNAEMSYPGGTQEVYMQMYSIQLFNVSKETFLFRHISEGNGTNGKSTDGQVKLFGIENGYTGQTFENETEKSISYNWIYDSDWSEKYNITNTSALDPGVSMFYNQPVISEEIWSLNGAAAFNTIQHIEPWLSGNTNADYALPGYVPWYYVSENTLPTTEKMTMALSTGILYIFKLCNAEGNPLIFRDNEGKDLKFPDENGELTLSSPSLIRITLKGGDNDGYYQEIPLTMPNSENNDPNAGYFLSYKYLIEHNRSIRGTIDNNTGKKNGALAPMQIGIVRNNIYALKVTGINNLPQPHEPDNFYLSVDIKVLAWAKRDITVTW